MIKIIMNIRIIKMIEKRKGKIVKSAWSPGNECEEDREDSEESGESRL